MSQIFQSALDFLETIVKAHPGWVIALVLSATLASILGSSLPAPECVWPEKRGRWYFIYLTFFTFLHIIAANFGRVCPWIRISANANGKSDAPTSKAA